MLGETTHDSAMEGRLKELEKKVQQQELDMASLRQAIYQPWKRLLLPDGDNITRDDVCAQKRAAMIEFLGTEVIRTWGLTSMYLGEDEKMGDYTSKACKTYTWHDSPDSSKGVEYVRRVYIGGPTGTYVTNPDGHKVDNLLPAWNSASVILHLVTNNIPFFNGMCPEGEEVNARVFERFYDELRRTESAAILTFYREPFALEWPVAQLLHLMGRGFHDIFLLVQANLEMPPQLPPEEAVREKAYKNVLGTVAGVEATMRERFAEVTLLLRRAIDLFTKTVSRSDTTSRVFTHPHSDLTPRGVQLSDGDQYEAELAQAGNRMPVEMVSTLRTAMQSYGENRRWQNAHPRISSEVRERWHKYLCVETQTRTDTALYLKKVFELTFLGTGQSKHSSDRFQRCVGQVEAMLIAFKAECMTPHREKKPQLHVIYPVAAFLNAMLPAEHRIEFTLS
jgi:hypothetical protein